MSFAEKVKKLLKENDMTKADLAKGAGIPYTTLDSMLKRETDTARLESIFRIARALGTSVEALVFDESGEKSLSSEEERILRLYSLLDHRGKNTVLSLLEQEAVSLAGESRSLPLYEAPAAAGRALPVITEEVGALSYREGEVSPKAAFAVRISGDSMEPLLSDGDLVFVEPSETIESGQIGIFLVNGESLCKRFEIREGQGYLVSINPNYAPIRILDTDDVRLSGRVTNLQNETRG